MALLPLSLIFITFGNRLPYPVIFCVVGWPKCCNFIATIVKTTFTISKHLRSCGPEVSSLNPISAYYVSVLFYVHVVIVYTYVVVCMYVCFHLYDYLLIYTFTYQYLITLN